jgi:hypothetical protein
MLLSHDDAAQFFRLIWGLQFYVSQQQHLVPDATSREAYMQLDNEQKCIVRDALWKHPQLIDGYLQANPDKLPADELAIIERWKKFVAGKFYILRYLKSHAIFMKDAHVYGVKGLYDSFEAVLGWRPLPILIEAVLLPYKGQIIYDGMCRCYNVNFGRGIQHDLNEEYLTAKQNGRIRLALGDDEKTLTPTDKVQVLAISSEKVAKEITQQSKKLRGGTAIQSAAFGVLRESTLLVETAAAQPDDMETLWRLGRKVGNALKRLEKVMERAER